MFDEQLQVCLGLTGLVSGYPAEKASNEAIKMLSAVVTLLASAVVHHCCRPSD